MHVTETGTTKPLNGIKLSPERAAIVAHVRQASEPLQARAIAEAVGIPRGSARHLLRLLAKDGLLTHHSGGRYSGGAQTFEKEGNIYAMPNPETQLDKARAHLEALREQLPDLHRRLTDAEHKRNALQKAVQAGNADFDDLAASEGRVIAAQNLLEHHTAALETARAEVLELEQAAHREIQLQTMRQLAADAKEAREQHDKLIAKLNADLTAAMPQFFELESKRLESIRRFASTGNALTGEQVFKSYYAGLTDQQEVTGKALFAELEQAGVDLSAVREGGDDLKLTFLSENRSPPPEPFGGALHRLFYSVDRILERELAKGQAFTENEPEKVGAEQ